MKGRSLFPKRFYGAAFLLLAGCLAYRATQTVWELAFLWPCVSALLVSFAYFRGATFVFGKRENGQRSPALGLLLLPFLFAARVVWELQTRLSGEPPWNAVGEHLIVARRLRERELPSDVAMIIDLTNEFVDPPSIRATEGFRCVPILDANALTPEVLVERVCKIPPPSDGRLLIHCANGHGRTGLFAAAWLVAHGLADSAPQALESLQAARPGIALHCLQRQALELACQMLQSTVEQQ